MKKRVCFLLVVLLIFSFAGCNQTPYDETEIAPDNFVDIIGRNVEEIDVKEMDYNVYGVRMSMVIAEDEMQLINAYRLSYEVFGPSKEEAVIVKDLYSRMCEDYGNPVSGCDFSNMTSDELYTDVTTNPSTFWHIGDDTEMELRYQLFNKNISKDMEATGFLDISVIIRSPIEVWS